MNVTLRQREKNGKIHLYLDYYHKKKRKTESLGFQLILKPTTTLERQSNRANMELAKSICAKRQVEFQNGIYGFPDLEKMNASFIQYFEILTEKRYSSAGNYGNWNSVLKHLKEFAPNDIKFSEIDHKWIEDFKEHLVNDARKKNKEKLSSNSQSSYFNKVRAALKQAVREGIILKNPAENVSGIKEEETKREFLTQEELNAAAKTDCDIPVFKQAFLFGCLTGLRFSDIKKMVWGEIQHSKDSGYFIRFKQKKTGGQETLPISDDTYNLLGERQGNDDVVFLGLEYNYSNNHRLQAWMTKAGIDKKITFHSGRHTFACLQLIYGTDIYTVSKLLGHKSLKTTEIYAKIIDQKKTDAVNKIKLS
jgi:integrase